MSPPFMTLILSTMFLMLAAFSGIGTACLNLTLQFGHSNMPMESCLSFFWAVLQGIGNILAGALTSLPQFGQVTKRVLLHLSYYCLAVKCILQNVGGCATTD